MSATDSFARQRVIDAAAAMIATTGSGALDFALVASNAGVDESALDSFFDSRQQLIAEAQMKNYFERVEPQHLVLSRVEAAVQSGDESTFWASVHDSMTMAWSSGLVDERWGVVKLLVDVWADPFSRQHFCDLLDIQFARWVAVIDAAKTRGWVEPTLDSSVLTAVFWSASVGQVITSGSNVLQPSPDSVRDFYLRIVRGDAQSAPSL